MKNILKTQTGNIITNNALTSDDGSILIDKAIKHIEKEHGWKVIDNSTLFSGVYYDSQKVGSFIVKVENDKKEKAVLKLQLRPLPYDEGFIIRHIEKENHSKVIRMPKIFRDKPWNEDLGFGFLIFEDLSHLPNLWINNTTDKKDRKNHANFLKEFFHNLLPVSPWLEKPKDTILELNKKGFKHFYEIAQASSYHHIDEQIVLDVKKNYFNTISKFDLGDLRFTHAHMSGKDIKYDEKNNQFILFANLYWSFRQKYYELTFPIWVDIMHTAKKDVNLKDLIEIIENWIKVFKKDIFDHNPAETKLFWLNLLQRSALTTMLDLGASEWKEKDIKKNQALLNAWKDLFYWIIKEKLT